MSILFNWNSHSKSICNGFSRLQQDEEFVDMTLAADGHIFKVHRNLMALASPYLKELLKSTPSQHPVIILSDISYDILQLVLEYIYIGEILIPEDKYHLFSKAASSMKLAGSESLDQFGVNLQNKKTQKLPQNNFEINTNVHVSKPDQTEPNSPEFIEEGNNINEENTSIHNFEDILNYNDDQDHQEIMITDTPDENLNTFTTGISENNTPVTEFPNVAASIVIDDSDNNITLQVHNFENTLSTYDAGESTEARAFDDSINAVQTINIKKKTSCDIVGSLKGTQGQYTVSTRGSLQMILNRYIYNCHHHGNKGKKRRWRCVDYRQRNCKAFLDTEDNVIVSRKFVHNHPFHDDKIMNKKETNMIFSSAERADEMRQIMDT